MSKYWKKIESDCRNRHFEQV